MPNFGEILGKLEEHLFVGRERELAVFDSWLGSETPSILNVSGPGGVGKSVLMRAFRRLAEARGVPTILLDAQEFRAVPEGLRQSLGATLDVGQVTDADLVDWLNTRHRLILVDGFDQVSDLAGYILDDLLPQLDSRVRMVIAGREALGSVWRRTDPELWRRIVQPMPLTRLTADETRTYLQRRGVTEADIIERVVRATGGYPLAVALAADLVVNHGLRDVDGTAEWHRNVRNMVERLLDHMPNARLRAMLEAAAVVREFDEAMLAAITDPGVAEALQDLWQLSLVRPVAHGLTLHEEVRRILAEDLRRRHPERYRELRRRAAAYLLASMSRAGGEEQERLLAAQLFLLEDAFVRDFLFADDAPGGVSIDVPSPDERPALLGLWASFTRSQLGLAEDSPSDALNWGEQFLHALLDFPDTRVRVARNRAGQVLGFNTLLPVCRASLPILEQHPSLAATYQTYAATAQHEPAAPTAEQARLFCLVHVVYRHEPGQSSDAARAALARDLLMVLARGGVYLAASPVPAYQRLLERLGWQTLRVPPRLDPSEGKAHAYVLDLRREGVQGWLARMLAPAVEPPPPREPVDQPRAEPRLTRRERELVGWIARGLQNRQIADQLGLSVRTVDAHVEHIRRKLGVHSRAQIAAWAVRNQALDEP